MTKTLLTVVGPTAIGKTKKAIELAQLFNTEIISCDSRQFYKEMSIGTAVPSQEELSLIPHHFIQHLSIQNNYSVGEFERDALQLLDQLFQEKDIVVMVGGSGLYVDAVTEGFDNFPTVLDFVKLEVENLYENSGLESLVNILKSHDPEYYTFLLTTNPQTLKNPQRIKRFVSVCLSSGEPYSKFIGKKDTIRNFNSVVIGLEAERDFMYHRINTRVDQMIQEGLVEEAKDLLPYRNLNALQTVGYRELFEYFDNHISLEEAIEQIKQNTRRFAKRQMTWFRRKDNILWFNHDTTVTEIVSKTTL